MRMCYNCFIYMLQFDFDDYYNPDDIRRALDQVPLIDEKTNTAAAIRLARTQLFTVSQYDP